MSEALLPQPQGTVCHLRSQFVRPSFRRSTEPTGGHPQSEPVVFFAPPSRNRTEGGGNLWFRISGLGVACWERSRRDCRAMCQERVLASVWCLVALDTGTCLVVPRPHRRTRKFSLRTTFIPTIHVLVCSLRPTASPPHFVCPRVVPSAPPLTLKSQLTLPSPVFLIAFAFAFPPPPSFPPSLPRSRVRGSAGLARVAIWTNELENESDSGRCVPLPGPSYRRRSLRRLRLRLGRRPVHVPLHDLDHLRGHLLWAAWISRRGRAKAGGARDGYGKSWGGDWEGGSIGGEGEGAAGMERGSDVGGGSDGYV
ncbi:hypothetical protein LshimejAT787_1300060 [Lyophyllum shimeji]|uniref:Uncharacterized protein n=1 Tax=Lyophyllum shimeji TaxID=47721 RepID=A0A9P3UT15_LYOSH|nr:hypothetical protein LshimejAT787_1300060 [Lyophyllum shimeji]